MHTDVWESILWRFFFEAHICILRQRLDSNIGSKDQRHSPASGPAPSRREHPAQAPLGERKKQVTWFRCLVLADRHSAPPFFPGPRQARKTPHCFAHLFRPAFPISAIPAAVPQLRPRLDVSELYDFTEIPIGRTTGLMG